MEEKNQNHPKNTPNTSQKQSKNHPNTTSIPGPWAETPGESRVDGAPRRFPSWRTSAGAGFAHATAGAAAARGDVAAATAGGRPEEVGQALHTEPFGEANGQFKDVWNIEI